MNTQGKGKIKSKNIRHGMGKKGPWTNYVFEMEDGFKCGTFTQEIGEQFNEGDIVEYAAEQNGQFFNLQGMRMISKGDEEIPPTRQTITPPPQPQPARAAGVAKPQGDDRNKSIIAQTLVKCVAQNKELNCEDALTAYKYFLGRL